MKTVAAPERDKGDTKPQKVAKKRSSAGRGPCSICPKPIPSSAWSKATTCSKACANEARRRFRTGKTRGKRTPALKAAAKEEEPARAADANASECIAPSPAAPVERVQTVHESFQKLSKPTSDRQLEPDEDDADEPPILLERIPPGRGGLRLAELDLGDGGLDIDGELGGGELEEPRPRPERQPRAKRARKPKPLHPALAAWRSKRIADARPPKVDKNEALIQRLMEAQQIDAELGSE